MSIKLTDAQLVMLSAAARRDDRSLTPPEKLKGGAADKVATKLIAAGLVKEVKAKAGTPVWRRDEQNGQFYALKLTAAGAKAIAVNPDDDAGPAGEGQRLGIEVDRSPTFAEQGRAAAGALDAPSAQALASPRAPRVGTKLAQAVEMLGATEGATIAELSEALDWLPHTTRAALTGLRKRGYALTLDRSMRGVARLIASAGLRMLRMTEQLRWSPKRPRATQPMAHRIRLPRLSDPPLRRRRAAPARPGHREQRDGAAAIIAQRRRGSALAAVCAATKPRRIAQPQHPVA